jgi:predicted amidophosphoribosyltransferase
LKISKHIEDLQNSCGLISAKEAFWKHFENIYLDEIFYADQYNWMEFWRWKLAEMTFYAKQSQNIKLINQANNLILLKLECIINQWNFDAIAITPWSIDRKNQLLWLLKDKLKNLKLPFVNIIKYYENNIPIPQKSLKTRQQRIQNATNTIFVEDKNISKYKKVFLIDDFVGSGSTLNITAQKLKNSWVKKVTWFSYVWNLNLSYEVINEV